MKTNHKFGMYWLNDHHSTFVMDDFGNAILLDEGTFFQAIEFIVTGASGYMH